MRLLIVGGGTGGHIYPALAVARSLQAGSPEVRAPLDRRSPRPRVAGHTGDGHPVPAAAAAFAALGRLRRPRRPRPDPAWPCRCRRRSAMLIAPPAGGDLHDRRLRRAARCCWRAAPLRIPVVMWDGNVVPGRSVRWTAGLADCLAVAFEETCRALGKRKPCFVTGTPIRDPGSMSRTEARTALGIPPEDGLLLIFGGSQAVRRFNAAVAAALPRLLARVRVIHVTGDAGLRRRDRRPRRPAGAPAPAIPPGAVPDRRDDGRARRRRSRRGPSRLLHAGRGRGLRAADGRGAVSARGGPSAPQRRGDGPGRGRAAGGGRGLRRGGAARGRRHHRRCRRTRARWRRRPGRWRGPAPPMP